MNSPENEPTIDQIVDSFSARIENGERPSIEEYKQKHPQLADKIEAVLPALIALENIEFEPSGRKLVVDDSIPEVLGDYQIIQEIGRGGMGVVFEAQHATMHRRVALKVLPKSSAEKPNYLNRFLTEARSAGQLHHTNIVPVFEVGQADELHFYAMQFIHGDNLDRVIEDVRAIREQSVGNTMPKPHSHQPKYTQENKNGLSQTIALEMIRNESHEIPTKEPNSRTGFREATTLGSELNVRPPSNPLQQDSTFSASQKKAANSKGLSDTVFGTPTPSSVIRNRSVYHQRVAAVGIQVAHALEYAHNHGVLHRDVKPANLILDTEGNVWVTDFGLAKLDSDDLTQTGDIIGTLRYMAPERFAGNADRRSDIYSLGLTLYELATLKCAFENDRGTLVKDVASSSSVISPRKIDESIPADLETIILKAIEPVPERRYQSALALADDLQLYLSDRPIKARRASSLEKCWRVCRRNPIAASLGVCIAALLAVVAIGSLQYANDQIEARKETEEFAAKETQLRKQLQQNLFDSKLEQAKMRRYSHRLGQRFESLAAIKQATDLVSQLELNETEQARARLMLRNEAIAAMALTDVKETWAHLPEPDWALRGSFVFDHANRVFAEGDETGQIRITQAQDSKVVCEIPAPIPDTPTYGLRFSPNGRYLLAAYLKPNAPRRKQTTIVWDLENLTEPILKEIAVEAVDFSSDSERWPSQPTSRSLSTTSHNRSPMLLKLFPIFRTKAVFAESSSTIREARSQSVRRLRGSLSFGI